MNRKLRSVRGVLDAFWPHALSSLFQGWRILAASSTRNSERIIPNSCAWLTTG
ncbi:unnamed protein product [Mycena citricolor]|uniref:Uncharacterized protein n=1 Tax=Mycena citricolor TaxID=2018698 RepID=A0AAD2H0Q8_9AGAR|nr:unnamed protein product [Mycena citricolor]